MSELRISALALLVATSLVAWSCASGEGSPTGDASNGGGGAPDDGFLGAGAAAEPSGTEVCDNGLDDDGDGNVDEGCACAPGREQACFPGPATQAGVGACTWGKQSCSGAGSNEFPEGTGACVGAGQPKAEACGDGIHNNCDGATDEGCGCTTGETMPCGVTQGICQAGTQTCIGGQWGDCVGDVGPELEICDGVDNNCDGQVDEGCSCTDGETKPCGQTIGACEPGTETCVNGTWGGCEGAIGPTPEVCADGVDNDCNGSTDEGCGPSTSGATGSGGTTSSSGTGCVPATACTGGKNCGTEPDGCGGTVLCGTCTAPQTCGGAGQDGVCGGYLSPICGGPGAGSLGPCFGFCLPTQIARADGAHVYGTPSCDYTCEQANTVCCALDASYQCMPYCPSGQPCGAPGFVPPASDYHWMCASGVCTDNYTCQ